MSDGSFFLHEMPSFTHINSLRYCITMLSVSISLLFTQILWPHNATLKISVSQSPGHSATIIGFPWCDKTSTSVYLCVYIYAFIWSWKRRGRHIQSWRCSDLYNVNVFVHSMTRILTRFLVGCCILMIIWSSGQICTFPNLFDIPIFILWVMTSSTIINRHTYMERRPAIADIKSLSTASTSVTS